MKKSIFNITLFFGLIVMAQLSEAQEKNGTPQQRKFYRKLFRLASEKEEQMAQAQGNYKKALGLVVADTSLNGEAKRAKIGLLDRR